MDTILYKTEHIAPTILAEVERGSSGQNFKPCMIGYMQQEKPSRSCLLKIIQLQKRNKFTRYKIENIILSIL